MRERPQLLLVFCFFFLFERFETESALSLIESVFCFCSLCLVSLQQEMVNGLVRNAPEQLDKLIHFAATRTLLSHKLKNED